ncbi:hypothetical protein [Glaesserella parasuis]|uniref:hypothetical protein n=1 Tax=Glaesserella parasuis TaxID=738 RepID=UPI0024371150|nr:hypothetical protein [Glaesserella parasuis]MDG6447333.1 hypothetical protein [Glaesserella parasuis]MDG6475252.1 hypothetical protein [Glaesserella parasuis]
MISEQDKQKIFNGAYGISRKGLKCKFVGFTNGSHSYIHMFVYFNTKGLIFNTEHLNEDFKYHTEFESPEDVIGLWEDKLEPFDLNKALNGEPVMLRNGLKAYVKYVMPSEYKGPYPLSGYILNNKSSDFADRVSWSLEGNFSKYAKHPTHDIISMWKEPHSEPESVKSIRNLPASLTKPQDGMYYLNECGVYPSAYGKEMDINIFNQRVYFASEQDGRDWFNAMKNTHK